MAERNLDFDTIIDRRNTDSLKYDFAKRRGMPQDVLPLWVADMDLQTSSYVVDALARRAGHGIFGYSEARTPYFEAVRGWMEKRHGWNVREQWLVKTPGVVFALAMAVKAYTQPGDSVLIQPPVYYPFSEVIADNGRKVVTNLLYQGEDGRYHMDLDDFEKKITEENIKLFFLCSPHNPVGRVWTKDELVRLGDICVRHHVIVVSDEIHQDFVFRGQHFVFADLKAEYEGISVTCTSPSKTFNLAGLSLSNIFIPDQELRSKFRAQLHAAGTSQLNVMGLVACEAAYGKGEVWYEAVRSYIAGNIAFTEKYVENHLPGVCMAEHEGTYLVWLDFRETGLEGAQLQERIVHRAKLWLDGGEMFGTCGSGFWRINVACPRSVLAEALERLKDALRDQGGRDVTY